MTRRGAARCSTWWPRTSLALRSAARHLCPYTPYPLEHLMSRSTFRSPVVVAAIVSLFLAPREAPAQGAGLPERIDAVFARFTRSTPGCAVGLAKDGKTRYTHGYGMANLERSEERRVGKR